ncbi:MAG TPA: RNA pyrophosphohydrolase [Caulobacteraceae bacterium]|nr:RNA pyrophosphohydrolase [Caulobacteraceae bacterium]
MSDPALPDLSLYRPNVGVVLFNAHGLVWIGRRAKTDAPHNWQFPQGGVDPGEDLYDAALRELHEETGVRSARLLDRTQDWMTYDFPKGWSGTKAIKGWRGQKQIWFAFRFEGEDGEIDLNLHSPPEFDAWRWEAIESTIDLVVPFKRAAYEHVISAFRRFAGPEDGSASGSTIEPSRRASINWLGRLFRDGD